jgi:hypothetical protein
MQNFFDELSKQAATAISRRDAFKTTGRTIVGLLLNSTPLAKVWAASGAVSTVLTTQAPNIVSGQENLLGVSLPIVNSGLQPLSGVTITAIQLQLEAGDDDYAELVAPTSFPILVGDLPGGIQFFLEATFDPAGLRMGTSHLLTVRGDYVLNGTRVRFKVQAPLVIPGPTAFFLGVNKTDELLLQAQGANGDIVGYFGPKDSNGVAMALDTLLVKSLQGGLSRYNLDDQGRPQQVVLVDGTTFTMNWSSSTNVLLTVVTADGMQNMVGPIDLASFQSAQVATFPVSGSAAQSLVGTPSSTISDTSTAVARIHVNHCRPVDNANVTLRYFPPNHNIPPTDLPATLIAPGTGTYSVAMPTFAAQTAVYQDACASVDKHVSGVCKAAQILGNVCFSIYALADAEIFASCVAAFKPIVLACQLGGGQLGLGRLLGSFCTFLVNIIDLAENGMIQMEPVAQIAGSGTVVGAPVSSYVNGPYPEMTVDFPGIQCGPKCCVPNVEICCANTQCCGVGTICCGTTCCDPALCCGTTCCASGQFCCGSTCQNEPCCPAGQIACGQTCCASGLTCSNGQCVCPSGQPMCGTVCCPSGQTCQNGACTACPSGQLACGQGCCGPNSACCPSSGGPICAPASWVCCPSPSLYCPSTELCCPGGCCSGAGFLVSTPTNPYPDTHAWTCCSVGLLSIQGPCCPPGWNCCPGTPPFGCCPVGQLCCPGGCCPPPSTACGPPGGPNCV